MKNLFVLAMLSLIFVSMSIAQEINLENLKSAHIAAMQYNGHSTLMVEKNNKMTFIGCEGAIASACYGESLSTAYMEKGDVKIYWYVEKIENGVMITFKATINGTTYTRSYKLLMRENQITFQDIDWAKRDDSRLKIDWDCLKGKIPGCITCLVNWVCWLGCAGSAVWQCVEFRETVSSRGFGCPKCDYNGHYYKHNCDKCGTCFSASSLTCPSCYSQRWSNGKVCARCGNCYK